ncbi:MAG: TAXI family TRAP transporter solute-binding subunit [Geminicoccaceae bacterium]
MSRRLVTTLCVLFGSLSTGALAEGHTSSPINLAIGKPGSESFVFGTELWAMSQIALKPEYGIDLSVVEVADDSERLALLRDAEIEVALVGTNVPTSHASHMRSVMAFWPKAGFTSATKPTQLLAHKDLSNDIVYRITQAIFEHSSFFKNTAETDFGIADRHHATVGTDLPIHPGASQYYHEVKVGFSSSSSGEPDAFQTKSPATADGKQPEKFVNFDDEALNDQERSQIAAACRQALELGALSLVLGDLSSRGCEVYQSDLEDSNDDQHYDVEAMDALFYPPAGQGGPAVSLDDLDGVHHAPAVIQQLNTTRNSRQPTM